MQIKNKFKYCLVLTLKSCLPLGSFLMCHAQEMPHKSFCKPKPLRSLIINDDTRNKPTLFAKAVEQKNHHTVHSIDFDFEISAQALAQDSSPEQNPRHISQFNFQNAPQEKICTKIYYFCVNAVCCLRHTPIANQVRRCLKKRH